MRCRVLTIRRSEVQLSWYPAFFMGVVPDLDRLVGEHRDEEVAVGAVFFLVEDRAQAEFGFQGTEDRLCIGQSDIGLPHGVGIPVEHVAAQTAAGRGRSADGGNLEPARGTVARLRLGLEGSRAIALDGGATLTPSLEVGVRHDGDDAETGFCLELGRGLALGDPKRGLQAELRGRGLLAHQSKGFRDLGFSGSLALERKPSSGGADALLARGTLERLAANDIGEGGSNELKSRRLELKFGYGLSAFGDRITWTAEAGIGLSDTGRDYSLG